VRLLLDTEAFLWLMLDDRDPFERFLVAQAISEQMPLDSVDPALDAYPVTRLW
jgi:PIN domain nuclease of toxin-antitoxin system